MYLNLSSFQISGWRVREELHEISDLFIISEVIRIGPKTKDGSGSQQVFIFSSLKGFVVSTPVKISGINK